MPKYNDFQLDIQNVNVEKIVYSKDTQERTRCVPCMTCGCPRTNAIACETKPTFTWE